MRTIFEFGCCLLPFSFNSKSSNFFLLVLEMTLNWIIFWLIDYEVTDPALLNFKPSNCSFYFFLFPELYFKRDGSEYFPQCLCWVLFSVFHWARNHKSLWSAGMGIQRFPVPIFHINTNSFKNIKGNFPFENKNVFILCCH